MSRGDRFLELLKTTSPIFSAYAEATARRLPDRFARVSERLIGWADATLGGDSLEQLVDGYLSFTFDVNSSQRAYEQTGRYRPETADEIYAEIYAIPEVMTPYHWGMYATLFAWEHHLAIVELFERSFLSRFPIDEPIEIVDLGCGSGVWSAIALSALPKARARLVDISPTTVDITARMLAAAGFADSATVQIGDATEPFAGRAADGAISGFVLAHLERPKKLFDAIAAGLKTHGTAFVTAALSAAESDHITEFRREGEVIALAEAGGFRLIQAHSFAPEGVAASARYLPRALALVLEKRRGEVW
jgi:SAM-dependent methyltransferase